MKKDILPTTLALLTLILMGLLYHFVQDYEYVFLSVGVMMLAIIGNK
jgi:hypothetical protein